MYPNHSRKRDSTCRGGVVIDAMSTSSKLYSVAELEKLARSTCCVMMRRGMPHAVSMMMGTTSHLTNRGLLITNVAKILVMWIISSSGCSSEGLRSLSVLNSLLTMYVP